MNSSRDSFDRHAIQFHRLTERKNKVHIERDHVLPGANVPGLDEPARSSDVLRNVFFLPGDQAHEPIAFPFAEPLQGRDRSAPATLAAPLDPVFRGNTTDDVTIVTFPGLNHLFQTAQTGSTAEYATIEETFNENALALMTSWITQRFVD